MEILGKDTERRQELQTGAMHACQILNNCIIPICKELAFQIDVTDTQTLDRYMRNISALHLDYIAKMREGYNNPALAVVLKKTAEELWEKAYRAHPILNPYICVGIPKEIFEFITITGKDINSFHARPNNPAIEKACQIEATQEDLAKKEQIEALCDALNDCFNGLGDYFGAYITVIQGHFVPVKATNYKPLYGE